MTAVISNKNTETSAEKPKSTAKNSVFRRRFFNDIIDSKRTAIVHCILCLLGLPLFCSMVLVMLHAPTMEDYEKSAKIVSMATSFMSVSIGMIVLSLLLGIVIALFNFSYLYRKTIADMHYSLPLSGNQRFFADLLSGLAVYTVPFIVSDIIGGLILRIGSEFIGPETIYIDVLMTFYIHSSVICLITMILYYSLCVLALTFCGSTFEAILSSIASIVMIPAVVFCFWADIVDSSGYGLDLSSVLGQPLLTSTNPIGAIIFYFRNYFASLYLDDQDSSYLNNALLKWSIITLLFAIAFVALSFLLYKRRKAEDVSKPYVFKSYFYIMLTMAVFCIVSLFQSGVSTIMPAIVICAVMWFIMEVITRRGFKRFWTAAVSFAVSVTVVIGVTGICRATEGFGISKRVPSASSVESLSVNSSLMDNGWTDIVLKDRDVIETAVRTNKDIIDTLEKYRSMDNQESYDEIPAWIEDRRYIELTYRTFTGKEIIRTYDGVSSEQLSDLMGAIYLSDEYADVINKKFDDFETLTGMRFAITDRLKSDYRQIALNKEQAEAFRRAYTDDLKAMTKDDLPNIGNVKYVIENTLSVPEFFENTLAVLESVGTKLPETDMAALEDGVEIALYPEIRSYFYPVNTFRNTRPMNIISHDTMTNLTYHYVYTDYDRGIYHVDLENPDSAELIKRLVPHIYKEKPIAVAEYGGNYFYLRDSEENRKLLDKCVVRSDQYYYDENVKW